MVGAGIAGLAATIAFARAGHQVTLVERDAAPPPAEPGMAFLDWERPGVPQRRLVHGFLPLARRLLRAHVPDIVDRLFAAGAHDVDLLEPVRARRPRPGDPELFALRCRRMVFEWVLRRAADADPAISIRAGSAVAGFHGSAAAPRRPAVISGVRLQSGQGVAADLVVDAAGRRSQVAAWLGGLGAAPPTVASEPCGLVYFSRFYERPSGGFPVAHRAALGYANAASAAADGRTFSLTFFVRAEEPGLRMLRQEAAFERAAAAIPGFEPWRDASRPLGGVSAMGALQNSVRRFLPGGRPLATGLIAVGDSVSHTNPALGRGMALALDHAFRAAAMPWTVADREECAREYQQQVEAGAEASYADAVASDDLARRLHAGEDGVADEPRALIARSASLAAAGDQDLYRAGIRQAGLLVAPGSLLREPWLGRARTLLERPLREARAGPDRDQMIAILEAGRPRPR